MALVNNFTDLIGNTPVIKLNNFDKSLKANVYVKLESFNPLSSVKDRIALSMIEDAESKGLIKEGATIIEPTSGNTGIAIAYIAASKGYKSKIVMPDSMSIERRKLLKIFGAELILTPAVEGMKGAIDKADTLLKETPNSFMLRQFDNPANPLAHRTGTGPEIWEDLDKKVDLFVAGIGTGGTITGVAQFLKEVNPEVKIIGVEPESSHVLSGGAPGSHKIQGIGAGFKPEILDTELIDDYISVKDEDAGETSRKLAKTEGILLGISAGANIWAAVELAKKEENKGKNIITIGCDSGERYTSTWLFE